METFIKISLIRLALIEGMVLIIYLITNNFGLVWFGMGYCLAIVFSILHYEPKEAKLQKGSKK